MSNRKELKILKDGLKGPILRIEDPRKHDLLDILKSYFREILMLARMRAMFFFRAGKPWLSSLNSSAALFINPILFSISFRSIFSTIHLQSSPSFSNP